MRDKLHRALGALLLGSAAALHAQTVTCPSGPLVNPVPDFTQWTIVEKVTMESVDSLGAGGVTAEQAATPEPASAESSAEAETPATPSSRTVVGQRTGDVAHIVTTLDNGSKEEIWRRGNVQAVLCTGWEHPVLGAAGADYFEGGFSWVAPSNFVTIAKLNGVDCMIFKTENAGAVIEVARRLPVLLRFKKENVGTETSVERTYQFVPMTSRTALAVPGEFAAVMAAQEKRVREVEALPERP